ncbi:tail fiber assembly protein [Cronobacter sakazakii]|nr:tail fiber assembly protein [Cronobacter sakazakii]
MVFNSDGFAEQDFIQKVYIADINGEYIGTSEVMISRGTGLPAGAYLDAPPPLQEGKAIIRNANGSEWIITSDYRGKTAYSTDKSKTIIINEPGDIPDGFTLSGPPREWEFWDGEKWLPDDKALKDIQQREAVERKTMLMNKASNEISLLQDAVDLDMATEDEKTRRLALKKFRVLLSRIDTTSAPDISWPIAP